MFRCGQGLRNLNGLVYLALGDPMQKRNYYRVGWIKFDIVTDVQSHIAFLSEHKVRISNAHNPKIADLLCSD